MEEQQETTTDPSVIASRHRTHQVETLELESMIAFREAVGMHIGLLHLRREGNVNTNMRSLYRNSETLLHIEFEKLMDKAVNKWLEMRKIQLVQKKLGER